MKRLALLAALLGAAAVQAAPQPAAIFADGMVLQRDQPIRVWGRAEPGEAITLHFAGATAHAQAGADGRFSATLPARPAGGPFELQLQGKTTVTLKDVLLGDVWLASGQSNMEWELRLAANGDREVAAANFPLIRERHVAHRTSLRLEDDLAPAPWRPALPPHAASFSAVAYFFAREVHRATGVPIGIVHSSWGGTHVETWTSASGHAYDPELAALVRRLPHDPASFGVMRRERFWAIARAWQGDGAPAPADAALTAAPAFDDSAWKTLDAPRNWEEQGLDGFDGIVWARRAVELTPAQAAGAAELQLGAIDDCDETFVNGQRLGGNCQWDEARRYTLPAGLLKPGRNVIAVRITDTGGGGGFHGDAARLQLVTAAGTLPLAGPWRARVQAPLESSGPAPNDMPTLLYNGMVHPLRGLGLRGVIWYQGESNVGRAARYQQAFPALIQDWRRVFGQPALPFYFVQLASFLPLANNTLAGSPWAELREAQRLTALHVPHTGMAVAIDIGEADDIHPRNKQDVGRRLALQALAGVYGQAVHPHGPRFVKTEQRGAQIAVEFDAPQGLQARGGGPLRGFAVAQGDGPFHPAQARIVGTRVVLESAAVAQPDVVRYGWFDNASEANLVGGDGLPASPFRTDARTLLTAKGRFVP